MYQNDYFENKDNNNNYTRKKSKISLERSLSKEKKFNANKLRETLYGENEISNEEDKPIKKESIIKGLTLVFIYFSVIIYSLLYMLTPEKTANLIFEGNLKNTFSNYSVYNGNNDFYKLDTIRIKENIIIMNISRNFRDENNNDTNNNYSIKLFYSNQKLINKIVINNNYISKEIDNGIEIYQYYILNDFPFWLALINDDNGDKLNITTNNLIDFSF